jgi:hypothetical protein
MRISDCCGSWMISKKGIWDGAYWSNHNSRDNFPDMSLGFLAAMDAAARKDLPADLALAAANAAVAGHAVGDRIIADSDIQMTVPEPGIDYEHLIPGGQVRPDGSVEWQDLGSFAACQDAYLAQALSTEGLDVPVPTLPLPGAIETSAIIELFRLLGLDPPTLPVLQCHSIDDAFFGLTFGEMMAGEIFGRPWYEVAFEIAEIFPELFPSLVGSTADDFKELEMGVMGLCQYAKQTGKEALRREVRQTLINLTDLHRILAHLAYTVATSPNWTGTPAEHDVLLGTIEEHYYFAAFMSSQCDIEVPLEDFQDFVYGENDNDYLESILHWGDTAPWTLLTDEEIYATVEDELAHGVNGPWIVERYRDRFGDTPPVRRAGDAYEAIGPAGDWVPAENPHHQWFSATDLLYDVPLCSNAPWILSCDWAVLGCERPDLDDSGAVDATDQALFDAAYATYAGVPCDAGNNWCDGADLDRSGYATEDDQAFMVAAQGCIR